MPEAFPSTSLETGTKTMPGSRQSILNFPAGSEYDFSNFVVSPGSQFAVSLAREICSGAEVPYQTLFLTGAQGMGKTHLLIAIGNHIAQSLPEKNVLYVHCPDFIRLIESNSAETAPSRLTPYENLDFFLMDDVDRIAGHPASQEKLYLIYNSIMERGGKIVFTGRTSPDDLPDTEDYLISRLHWGMTAEIQAMDDATSARLFEKLGRDVGVEVPEKTVAFLLKRIPRDFPSIQDAVTRINEESLKQKKKVSLPLVKTALSIP